MALAREESPCNVAGAYNVIASTIKDQELIAEAFRTGRGVGWHEHHHSLFAGDKRVTAAPTLEVRVTKPEWAKRWRASRTLAW